MSERSGEHPVIPWLLSKIKIAEAQLEWHRSFQGDLLKEKRENVLAKIAQWQQELQRVDDAARNAILEIEKVNIKIAEFNKMLNLARSDERVATVLHYKLHLEAMGTKLNEQPQT